MLFKKFIKYVALIFGIFFISYFVKNKYDSCSSALIISYDSYNKTKDLFQVSALLEQNKFWLFHGNAEEGKKKILNNILSELHQDDFDEKKKVPYFVKVARIKEKVIGFITYFGSEEKKVGRIHLLAVDGDFRRSGVAQTLINIAISYFKEKNYEKVFLYTRPENMRAKKLYKKLNFYEINQEENVEQLFDKNPGDILVLEL